MLRSPSRARSIASAYTPRTVPSVSTTRCMAIPVGCGTRADDLPPGPVDHEPVELRLHDRHLACDVLPQALVVLQVLRADAADQLLGPADHVVQVPVGL